MTVEVIVEELFSTEFVIVPLSPSGSVMLIPVKNTEAAIEEFRNQKTSAHGR